MNYFVINKIITQEIILDLINNKIKDNYLSLQSYHWAYNFAKPYFLEYIKKNNDWKNDIVLFNMAKDENDLYIMEKFDVFFQGLKIFIFIIKYFIHLTN